MTCYPRHGIRGHVEMITCPRCLTTAIGNPGEPRFYLAARLATHPCAPRTVTLGGAAVRPST